MANLNGQQPFPQSQQQLITGSGATLAGKASKRWENRYGVAEAQILVGAQGILETEGIHPFKKASGGGSGWSAGARLTFSAADTLAKWTPQSATPCCGRAPEAAADADTVARVRLGAGLGPPPIEHLVTAGEDAANQADCDTGLGALTYIGAVHIVGTGGVRRIPAGAVSDQGAGVVRVIDASLAVNEKIVLNVLD